MIDFSSKTFAFPYKLCDFKLLLHNTSTCCKARDTFRYVIVYATCHISQNVRISKRETNRTPRIKRLRRLYKIILREDRFETPTWRELINQNRNIGQLFWPPWVSSALCSEDMEVQPKSQLGPVHHIKFRTLNSLTSWNMRCPDTFYHSTCFGAQVDKVSRLVCRKAKKINVARHGPA